MTLTLTLRLVERLIARHPDLADLAQLPLPGEVKRAEGAPVTRILLTMGDDNRAQGPLKDAQIVYRAVIDATLAVYERIRDEESEIADIVGNCAAFSAACSHPSAPRH